MYRGTTLRTKCRYLFFVCLFFLHGVFRSLWTSTLATKKHPREKKARFESIPRPRSRLISSLPSHIFVCVLWRQGCQSQRACDVLSLPRMTPEGRTAWAVHDFCLCSLLFPSCFPSKQTWRTQPPLLRMSLGLEIHRWGELDGSGGGVAVPVICFADGGALWLCCWCRWPRPRCRVWCRMWIL